MINDSMNYKRITIFAKDTQNEEVHRAYYPNTIGGNISFLPDNDESKQSL